MAPTTAAEDHLPFDLSQIAPWYKRRECVILYCLLLPAAMITPTGVGFDNSMTNALQTLPRFQEEFGYPRGASLGFFGASQSLGAVFGAIIGPIIADAFGRRAPVLIGSMIVIGSTFGQVWALNFGMFCAFKVMLGLGVGLAQIGAPILVAELSHPKERVVITNFYNTTIYLGMIIGAWSAFGTYQIESAWSWKLPCMLQIVCSSYQMFFIYLCPESPRWLIAHGKSEKAFRLLTKYHGGGDPNSELVAWEISEMTAAIEREKEMQIPLLQVVRDRGFQHRAFICICCGTFSQTSGNGLVSTYLVSVMNNIGITETRDQTIINGCVSIWSLLVGVICAWYTSKMKRRPVFLAGTGAMLVSFIGWTIAQARYDIVQDKAAGYAVIALVFIFNAAYGFAWLYLVVAYPIEVSNYLFRARLWALTMMSIGVSGFFNAYINPIGLENAGWKFYIYYDVWILCELVIIYFFFPETSGRTLEEVAVVFDGERADIMGVVEKVSSRNEQHIEDKESAV